jgi:hypothetical protein
VNPITAKYWAKEFGPELRGLVASDESSYGDFRDARILEEYLESRFRSHWRMLRREHGHEVDPMFIEILEKVASEYEGIRGKVVNIIKEETEPIEYSVKVEDEDALPLPKVRVDVCFRSQCLATFFTDDEGVASIKLSPEEREMLDSLELSIQLDGYEPLSLPLSDLRVDQVVRLKREAGELVVKIVGDRWTYRDVFEECPIEGAVVDVFDEVWQELQDGVKVIKRRKVLRSRSDKGGVVKARLPFGTYKVRVSAKDFQECERSLTINRKYIEEYIKLKPSRFEALCITVVRGTPTLPEPVKGCRVIGVLDSRGDPVPYIPLGAGETYEETDENGQIVILSTSDAHFKVADYYTVRVSDPQTSEVVEARSKPPKVEVVLKTGGLKFPYGFDELRMLTPYQFEKAVKQLLENLGYRNVAVTGRPADGGVDLVCEDKEGKKVVVQCKRWINKVGAEEIRSFIGAITISGANKGIFITTSSLTKEAKIQVSKFRYKGKISIEIYDSAKLRALIGSHGKAQPAES